MSINCPPASCAWRLRRRQPEDRCARLVEELGNGPVVEPGSRHTANGSRSCRKSAKF
jgi:hypothetical protein